MRVAVPSTTWHSVSVVPKRFAACFTPIGVPTTYTQVETISFGKEKPKALGDTEADYAENRRADFNYKR